ncbi:DUF494 family protein [Vibrio sp. Of7-15]|uniref:DUF494 family protein n=1 Tax=Vibrio sp. Of7-15 TaxID=2724879 RepID=UPI001EF3BCB3|nr:DUF494 family protein [Vibrio sp. Of7-15]MCG7499249.1 DUF494 family protein [Vibrio sp. Of7-15]
MMDILMYLFETYIHSDVDLKVDQDELEEELLRAGFHQQDIYKALNWLEQLALLQEDDGHPYLISSASTSVRIFTADEMNRLDVQSRGFLMFLEQVNVLSSETREMVIDRVMGLETLDFSLEDLKWVILMVLFNVPGNENAYTQMEELIYNVEEGLLH